MKYALLLVLLTALVTAQSQTKYTYDRNGRLTRVDYSGGRAIVYAYDASGNLIRREIIAPKPAAPAKPRKPDR